MNTTQVIHTTNQYADQTLIGRYVSKDNITLIFSEDTVAIDNSNPKFSEILRLCKNGMYADAAGLATIKDQISAKFHGSGVEVEGGKVYFNGAELHNVIADRILDMLRDDADASSLVNFITNLMNNSSFTAVQELYLFLESNRIPLTEDGYFLAWKKIRHDWKDIHSGTIDYSVGSKPEMPRNQVDEDRERTCSKGLHVAGWDYLPHFGSSGSSDRVVIVKVNPADVVSVPSDYNNAKMRVSKMEVLREYADLKTEADEFNDSVVSSDGERLYTSKDLDEAYENGYDDARGEFNDDYWNDNE
jgi:predicted DNA binding protein